MAQAFLNGAVFDFEAAPRFVSPGVEVHSLPGHTSGPCGAWFSLAGQKILLAGDTIMNLEYYNAREGHFIDASQEKTAASMDWAAKNGILSFPDTVTGFLPQRGRLKGQAAWLEKIKSLHRR